MYRLEDRLAVVSQLEHSKNESEETISTVSDSIQIPDSGKEESAEHYVLGKNWEWGESEGYQFFQSIEQVRSQLQAAERIYPSL